MGRCTNVRSDTVVVPAYESERSLSERIRLTAEALKSAAQELGYDLRERIPSGRNPVDNTARLRYIASQNGSRVYELHKRTGRGE
jgi:hypothetical protein